MVDVRTEDEYNEGHLSFDGVKNIDMKQPDFINRAEEELDKGKTVAVYCRSGRRSADAARQLAECGFKVIDLKGGILEWQATGARPHGVEPQVRQRPSACHRLAVGL